MTESELGNHGNQLSIHFYIHVFNEMHFFHSSYTGLQEH